MYSINVVEPVKLKDVSLNMYEVYLAATLVEMPVFSKYDLLAVLARGGWHLESKGSTYLSRLMAMDHIDHTLDELLNSGILKGVS